MTDSENKLLKLHCENAKCDGFFDYLGRLHSNRGINCKHCRKSSQYGLLTSLDTTLQTNSYLR